MKGLIYLFVYRPVTVIMILASLLIAAVFSLFSLPVNRLPDFSVPRVTVETVYTGMAANEIRSLVTIPLEDSLSPVKGLERIRSVSRDGRSLISMDFRWGTDAMAASVLVREAVDTVYPSLPEGIRKPAVTSGDIAGGGAGEPHAVVAVMSRNGNAQFARKLAEYELRTRLRRIDGAGAVILAGGEITEEKISLDTARLAALGLAPSDFVSLLARETADIPAGNARDGNMELVVVASGRPDSPDSLSRIILPAGSGTLKVEDAGEITQTSGRRESIFVYDGKEAAALEIYRRPGADPLRLSREIRKTVNEASSLFSRDAQIELVADSSPSLLKGITNLLISSALAAAAVISVLLLFIRRLRYSMLAAISIPVSAAASVCVLSIMGKSLNGMSLGGLAMSIGLVSDISVIVLDLLHKTFAKRNFPPSAQEIGDKTSTVAGSSSASTLTTALVFVPIIFLPGPLGSLFADIAVTLVTSVFAGWIYAMFFLPSLYRLFYAAPVTANTNKTFIEKISVILTDGSLERKYQKILSLFLHRQGKVFAAAALLAVFGFFSLLLRPVVFINPDEAEEICVSLVFPPGTTLESTKFIVPSITNSISGLPSVKTVYGRAGAEEEDSGRRADIDYKKEEFILRCVLERGVKPEKTLSEIRSVMEQFAEIPSSVYFPKDKSELMLGISQERTFVIKGKDRREMLERAKIAENSLSAHSVPVSLRPRGKRPELRIVPNREAAAYLSIPASQIAQTLYVLNEGVVAASLEIDGRSFDVRVTGKSFDGDPVMHLEQIPLKTAQGKTIYLGSLGRIERVEAEASLARLDRSDAVYLDILSNGKIPAAVSETAARFSWFTRADESVFNRYRNSLLLYIFLVLIMLYMAMGAQFESFLLPLILMMSIPFSLAGAGPALLLTGAKIDSGVVLGLATLFGLVVNNSLVLFEISEQKIRAGYSAGEAVTQGACERLQAIFITMATTIFALLPLVLSPPGNSQKSMAAAMIGGLAASTMLSLFAIPPVLIRFFSRKEHNTISAAGGTR